MENIIEYKNLYRVSKFLSLVLRHKPEIIGLTLNKQGWAEVNTLVDLVQQKGIRLNHSILEQIVINNDKKRFSFNEDKSKIRANQGHSIAVNLNLVSRKPPEYLFHGTAAKFIESIYSLGLLRRKRNHVHLSSDEFAAIKVGKRHGTPIVLKIRAEEMYYAGHSFYLSENQVWLTNHVPPEYISSLQQEKHLI